MGLTHRHLSQATAVPGPAAGMAELPGYAELHCLSNFSFQRGASHPQELVTRAAQLGYQALALTEGRYPRPRQDLLRAWRDATPAVRPQAEPRAL